MSELTEEPNLLMVAKVPDDLTARPPLASSLQSFESCLLLITLDRYPHAFTACVFAIESALKAAYRVPDGSKKLYELMNDAWSEVPNLQSFSTKDAEELRKTRNRIVHYGFSPPDDNLTTILLLKIAIPFLAEVYKGFFSFDLYDGFIFGEHLRNGLDAFHQVKERSDANPKHCFVVLVHLLRDSLKHNFVSELELQPAEHAENILLKDEIVEQKREWVECQLGLSWTFDCPVCGGVQTFICQILEKSLNENTVSLAGAYCLDCGLLIPKDFPFLANALCQVQNDEQREAVLRDCGFV